MSVLDTKQVTFLIHRESYPHKNSLQILYSLKAEQRLCWNRAEFRQIGETGITALKLFTIVPDKINISSTFRVTSGVRKDF
jgi:hypothetical protein